ncbi:hypothetical protein DL841_04055 [Escherichia coli]|nr:hypothetical protein [Escherichia coli]
MNKPGRLIAAHHLAAKLTDADTLLHVGGGGRVLTAEQKKKLAKDSEPTSQGCAFSAPETNNKKQ